MAKGASVLAATATAISILVLTYMIVRNKINIRSGLSNKVNVLLDSSNFVQQLDIDEQTLHFALTAQERHLAIMNGTLFEVMSALVPQIRCATAVRLGRTGDGGKWICNPWRALDNCVVYSFGVNGDTSFEKGIYSVTKQRCKIFSFDLGEQNLSIFESFHGTFKQWAIIGESPDKTQSRYTVTDVAKEFAHNRIEFMKMDIERSEFAAIDMLFKSDEWRSKRLTICQISIEVHNYRNEWVKLLHDIEKNGFYMFYKEANHMYTYIYEYSYIHESCLEQFGVHGQPFNYNFE